MDFFDIVKDTVEGFVKANVPMTNFIPDFKKAEENPLGSLGDQAKSWLNMMVPAVPLGEAALSSFSTKPNVEGAGGTPILAAALSTLREMLESCGAYRTPDEGNGFQVGADSFNGIADGLGMMGAPDSWTGSAAEAYTFTNGLQRDRAREMARIDRRIHEAIKAEAADNADTRVVLGECAQELNSAIAPATALGALPVGGDELSLSYQANVVLRVMPVATARYYQLTQQAAAHAAEVQSAGNTYHPIRGDYDGREPNIGTSGEVRVVPDALRSLSQQQERAAETIGSTKNVTAGAVGTVKQTHGTVCDGTGAALSAAVQARTATIEWMQGKSQQLAENLGRAAQWYEGVDQQEHGKLKGEIPHR